jgi:hypothetical protein
LDCKAFFVEIWRRSTDNWSRGIPMVDYSQYLPEDSAVASHVPDRRWLWRRAWDPRQLATLAVSAMVAGVVAAKVETISVSPVLNLGVIAAAAAVASGILRLVDAVALHGQVAETAAFGASTGEKMRQSLEERQPGIAGRAAKVDASALVERSLRQSNRGSRRG